MTEPIYLDITNQSEIQINKKEALRYLGYILAKPDNVVESELDSCMEELHSLLKCRAAYTRRPVQAQGDYLDFGFAGVESRHLAKNLQGCTEVYLFVATIGADVDRRIRRYQMTSPAKAAICQAVGAAAIEAYCDLLNDRWKKEEEAKGGGLRHRFSPGYGDLPLDFQKPLLRELDAARKLGLCLTDACLMVPEKSVSAVIGVENHVGGKKQQWISENE